MLSVLAFKRSLSAGVLDGGSGEISLGGSRLNRFMKEVENVTGRMGESEAVTPAEEVCNSTVAADAGGPVKGAKASPDIDADDGARSNGHAAPWSDPDPWVALAQVGAQFVAALTAANDPTAPTHPWIERDPATGVPSLRMPLPSPETARQLAGALSALANGLRGGVG